MADTTGFCIFLPEIWILIVKKLKNYSDLERVCIALTELYQYVDVILKELREREAIKCLLRSDAVTKSDALVMRQVCKNWRNLIDECVSKPLIRQKNVPFVTIQLPLDEEGSELVKKLAGSNDKPFIGGRLVIKLQIPDAKTSCLNMNKVLLLLEATSAVWQHVKELILYSVYEFEFDSPGGLEAVFRPWLFKMTNVLSMICDLDSIGVEAINCLPNPDLLQHISIGTFYSPPKEQSHAWTSLLEQCCRNLNQLIVSCIDKNLKISLETLFFPKLKELFAVTYNYCDDCDRQAQDSVTFAINLVHSIKQSQFPVLTKISIPLISGTLLYDDDTCSSSTEENSDNEDSSSDESMGDYWNHSNNEEEPQDDDAPLPEGKKWQEKNLEHSEKGKDITGLSMYQEQRFYEQRRLELFEKKPAEEMFTQTEETFAKELVDFTNRMTTLTTVQLFGVWETNKGGLALKDFPICPSLNNRGSPAITRLIIEGHVGKFEKVLHWSKNLSEVFPCVKYMKVGNIEMAKSITSGLWYKVRRCGGTSHF